MKAIALSPVAQVTLVLLRTLIGWHFLYEGYFKLMRPAWSAAGAPLPSWSSTGYLKAAAGPFASFFHRLAESSWIGTIDTTIPIALAVVGLLLMLGLFTQLACMLALVLLATFYTASIPMSGLPEPGSEGAYLIVNKPLVEAAAIAVVFALRTDHIAGLDRWRGERAVAVREAT